MTGYNIKAGLMTSNKAQKISAWEGQSTSIISRVIFRIQNVISNKEDVTLRKSNFTVDHLLQEDQSVC